MACVSSHTVHTYSVMIFQLKDSHEPKPLARRRVWKGSLEEVSLQGIEVI